METIEITSAGNTGKEIIKSETMELDVTDSSHTTTSTSKVETSLPTYISSEKTEYKRENASLMTHTISTNTKIRDMIVTDGQTSNRVTEYSRLVNTTITLIEQSASSQNPCTDHNYTSEKTNTTSTIIAAVTTHTSQITETIEMSTTDCEFASPETDRSDIVTGNVPKTSENVNIYTGTNENKETATSSTVSEAETEAETSTISTYFEQSGSSSTDTKISNVATTDEKLIGTESVAIGQKSTNVTKNGHGSTQKRESNASTTPNIYTETITTMIITDDNMKKEGYKCTGPGKFRYENSCKRYYYCDKIGQSNSYMSDLRECQICSQFNAKTRFCDFPENVNECQPDNGKEHRTCTGAGNFSIPLERNCRKYYECKADVANAEIKLTVKICPYGTIFSSRYHQCAIGYLCPKFKKPKCKEINYTFADKFECSKYYSCDYNQRIHELTCPPWYVFNGRVCEWKENVVCDPDALLDEDLKKSFLLESI
ncbi:hypothetical protein FQA39_LY09906 [Lamprigera yunnana]|nr:hypothetical protein FQA39_LY09906 [Lamprigera yunnana]